MRGKVLLMMAGAVLAMTAWARVGETPDETEVRYGTPLDSHPGLYSNTMVRTYSRAGILVEATFFMSNSGKSIVGEITYSLPYPTGQSNELTKVVLLKLLDANAAGQVQDEDLPVADAARAGARDDRVDRRLDELLVDGDLQLHLSQQTAGFLVAAIDLGDALLPAAPDHLRNGHQVDFLLLKPLEYLVQAVRLNYGGDVLHCHFLAFGRAG